MALEMLLVIVRHLLSERNLPAARQQLEMAKKVYQLLPRGHRPVPRLPV